MRIAILTSGRFHVCDLARELNSLGHNVEFYSCVPKSRTRQFGLPDNCNKSLLPYLAPLFVMLRNSQGTKFQHVVERLFIQSLDWIAAKLISRCDVFIGMSGMCNLTAQVLRQKYSAKIWIERGSRHIQSQKNILESIPDSNNKIFVSNNAVKRELKDYSSADVIVIPSLHVEQSFIEQGINPLKLFRNPYGVDLQMFKPTFGPPRSPFTLIMAGNWSLQKGCDVLINAWQTLPNVQLIHVGNVIDLPLPKDNNFQHIDPVPQTKLRELYAKAHVFVLASRQEGLALVLAQALACGLRIVCTDRTGGEDLKEFLEQPDLISVVPADNPNALAQALQNTLQKVQSVGIRDYLGNSRSKLSWKAYGERYDRALRERV